MAKREGDIHLILARPSILGRGMDKQSIELLNKYYKECIEIDYTHANFEKIIIITCVLISEARMSIVFPVELKKASLSIEWKIKKLIQLTRIESEHLSLAANIFREIAQHRFPSQTTVEHYLIATFGALDLNCRTISSDQMSRLYPNNVHIETQAVCNAKCSFCEYDSLSRKGEKMSDENIKKIISDLSLIPFSRNVQIQPYKVSEPFLEKRLPWITDEILNKIPGSKIRLISNGNLMTEEKIDWLIDCSNREKKGNKKPITISISLNSTDKAKYEKLMQVNYDRTIRNISNLHKRFGEVDNNGLKVVLTRVSTNAAGDLSFLKECARLFPNFQVSLLKLNDWFSYNEDSRDKLIEMGVPLKSFKKFGCTRWEDLSIAADGSVTLCCMDAGKENLNLGNAFADNVLNLYQTKYMRFIPDSGLRGDSPNPCNSCSYFQNTDKLIIPNLKNSLISANQIRL